MARELRAFTRAQVWFALGIGAIGFGGLFAVYTYVAPLATDVTGLEPEFVPIVLIVIGLGMTVGNIVGGRLADWSVRRSMYLFFAILAAALVLLGFTAAAPVGLFIGVFLVGGHPLRSRRRSRRASWTSRATASRSPRRSTTPRSTSATAWVRCSVASPSRPGSATSPRSWIGLVLTLVGVVLALGSFALDRARGRRGVVVPYATGAMEAVDA